MGERIQNVRPKEYKCVKYRSTLEADTAEKLDALGISFEYEPRRITLLESFRCPFQKGVVRAIHYTPDFIIGDIIIECKGFETPEWKNKLKYIYKYLMENEPQTSFHVIHNSTGQLLDALDFHWENLGISIEVTSKGSKKVPEEIHTFPSIKGAMDSLGLAGKHLGSIMRALTGETTYVYGYKWKLKKN